MLNKLRMQEKELVERLGIVIEQQDKLAPVAARILSYTILKGKRGTTFDDLVTSLCASKSTISTHLNHLQDLKKILYFTKPGDRKKYFVINEDTIIQNIDNMVESWNQQKELHVEIKVYKEAVNHLEENQSEPIFDIHFHEDYIEYLNVATELILKLKNKIIQKNTKQ